MRRTSRPARAGVLEEHGGPINEFVSQFCVVMARSGHPATLPFRDRETIKTKRIATIGDFSRAQAGKCQGRRLMPPGDLTPGCVMGKGESSKSLVPFSRRFDSCCDPAGDGYTRPPKSQLFGKPDRRVDNPPRAGILRPSQLGMSASCNCLRMALDPPPESYNALAPGDSGALVPSALGSDGAVPLQRGRLKNCSSRRWTSAVTNVVEPAS